MAAKEKLESMSLVVAKSGKGVYMVSPSGKKNIFCDLKQLKEFIDGKRDSCKFLIDTRGSTYQSGIDSTMEDG